MLEATAGSRQARPAMSSFGPYGGYEQFPPINQGLVGCRSARRTIPPATTWAGRWPMSASARRHAPRLGGFWIVAWVGLVAIGGMVSAVGGDSVGQVASMPLLIVIYALGHYNVGLQQSRTSQSWGKRML